MHPFDVSQLEAASFQRFSARSGPLERPLANAMTAMQNLKALSKSSARLATFAVRLCDGESETYTFTSKKSGQLTTANKFEVTLVGKNPEEYCKGYVKAS